MKKYLVRSVKYFFALCVLCAAIMALNMLTRDTLSPSEWFYVMFHTTRGLLLPAVIVLLAAFYPMYGFTKRCIEGDIAADREQIVNAFRSAGFSLRGEHDGVLVFRADRFTKRLFMLFEDEIKVTQYGERIELDGIRRGVARVEYRLESYLQMKRND